MHNEHSAVAVCVRAATGSACVEIYMNEKLEAVLKLSS